MAGLIVASGAAIVSKPDGIASLTLDTRGATVIYLFAYSVFQPAAPFDGFDSESNSWKFLANTFSSCNGSSLAIRVFNPITSATHNFRVQGNPNWSTQLIIVAMAPTFSGETFIQRRATSGQTAPAHPGSLPANPGSLPANYALITQCVGGCGLSGPTVDSGFTIIEALPEMAVAINVMTANIVDVSWSGLTPNPDANSGTGIVTAGTFIEGFGIYNGTTPPAGGAGTRIYEA